MFLFYRVHRFLAEGSNIVGCIIFFIIIILIFLCEIANRAVAVKREICGLMTLCRMKFVFSPDLIVCR